MAEFALGLTKTAVAGTLSRVKSAIEEEAAIKERVQEDLEFITGEFEMMQSFLRGANAADRAAKNQVVRTWVRQLRDLAFDVEDCVEFVIHLGSPPWTNWLWRVVPSCCKAGAPPLALDDAVAEIKRLKTRVADVSQRNTRYNLLFESTAMADQPIMLPPPTTTTASSSSAAPFHILNEVWQAAGKLHSPGTDLKDLMTSAEGNELQVVSLWPGSHSTGANLHLSEVSCLIREAYNDPEIYSEFECRAWVNLTMSHPAAAFNTQEFLNSLMAQFCPGSSSGQLASELLQRFSRKRYLLVIQGVSTAVEWDAIKMYLPDNNNGSRIIVSTPQLRTALLCTGDPYRVSELTRFSDGQLLYAFSKVSGLRRDMGELIWQIKRGGVISVLGDLSCRDSVPGRHEIRRLYKFLMYKHKDLDGVLVYKELSWVDVPNPFDLEAFCVQLFLNFQSGDFQAKEIAAVGLRGVAERCRKYLLDGDCLVFINGLQSKEDWDTIKETFLLSVEPMAEDTSIVVITKEASVAAYCAEQQNRCLNMEDVEDDIVLRRLIQDLSGCGIGGKEDSHRAHLLFHDPIDAPWRGIYFKLLGRINEVSALEMQIKKPGVIAVWGYPGVGKSAVVRKVYYDQLRKWLLAGQDIREVFTSFSWVDVPNRPFDLTDFSWHLLLDFHSLDVKAKEHAGAAMLRGQNPIEDCCGILRQEKCLVVIDGLQSERDWDKIKATFFCSEPAATLQGCIVFIVITDNPRVASHCVVDEEEGRVLHVKSLGALRRPLTKVPPVGMYERGDKASGWAAEFDLVGRINTRNVITNGMRRGTLFSLWGVAGVGKSAVVRHVYHKYITGRDFQEQKTYIKQYSWVDVPDPFDLKEFSHRLLLGFHSDNLQAKEIAAVSIIEGHDTVHRSCKIMRRNPCFIVIDGLRSTHDWDLIRAAFFSETDKDSHIIVITNEASIAMHCVEDKSNVLNVTGLNATDVLHLFRKIAWCGKEQLRRDEKEFSEPIVARCGGLPEVIAAIAEYAAERIAWLGNRSDFTLKSISQEINHDFMGKLENDSRFQSLRGLFSWMQSYFHACPDSLKPCIFYLSVFPVGQNIRRRRLLRRWIAEGYSTNTSPGVTAEANGEMLLADLVKLSIIQLQQQTPSNSSRNNKKKIFIQVNGFYHGYIISRPMEDNLVFSLEEHCSIDSRRTGQHLTISSSWDRDKAVYQSIDFTRLRSLTVFGEWNQFFISPDINMRLLRVLDLEDTTSGVTDGVLEQIGKLLPRLKFLSLQGCKEITRIPDSFAGLRQLQTLDVRHTSIVTLSHVIINLVKLNYIHAGTRLDGLDEVDDVGLPTSDRDESVEGSDDTIAGVATPLVDKPLSPTLAAENDDCTSTSEQATVNYDGTSTSLPGMADGGGTSTNTPAAEGGDGTITSQPATALATDQLIAATMDCGDISKARASAKNSDDTSTRQPTEGEDRTSATQAPWMSRAHDLVVSYSCTFLSKKKSHDNNKTIGVEIPATAVGKLTGLHTLGIINVSGTRGKAVLKELHKLTQLRKLRICGINRKKFQDLCCAISGHGHLESFAVRLDKNEDAASFVSSSDDMLADLPKTLKSLKLYMGNGHGNVQVPPGFIKQLDNLRKINFELKISTQEDIDDLVKLPNKYIVSHLCVKPNQDGELRYGWWESDWLGQSFKVPVLKIDCGVYSLAIVFGPKIPCYVNVLSVHCSSTKASVKLSGLEKLRYLEKVTLKGTYSEAVKRHLQQQVDEHENEPVLKLEDGENHQSPEPKAPCERCRACASCCFSGIIST